MYFPFGLLFVSNVLRLLLRPTFLYHSFVSFILPFTRFLRPISMWYVCMCTFYAKSQSQFFTNGIEWNSLFLSHAMLMWTFEIYQFQWQDQSRHHHHHRHRHTYCANTVHRLQIPSHLNYFLLLFFWWSVCVCRL